MTVRKWKRGGYQIDISYRNQENKRCRLRFILKKASEDQAGQIDKAIATYLQKGGDKPVIHLDTERLTWGEGIRPFHYQMETVAELCQVYLDNIPADVNRDLSERSLYVEAGRVRKLVSFAGNSKLQEIQQFAESFMLYARKTYKPETQVHYWGTLNRIGKYGKKNGHIPHNPVETINKPKRRLPIIFPLSERELEEFIELSSARDLYWTQLFQFAAYSGLRRGEIMALTWADVDFDRERITVNKAADEKGNIGIPKWGIQREVPLLMPAYEALPQPGRHSDFVFPSKTGGILRPSSYARTLKSLINQYARSKPMTFHTFRHSYATNLLASGVPIQRVSKWLGHTSVTTTERRYDGMQSFTGGAEADVQLASQLGQFCVNKRAVLCQRPEEAPRDIIQ